MYLNTPQKNFGGHTMKIEKSNFKKLALVQTLKEFHSAKDEGLGACAQTRVRRRIFFVFSEYGGVSSHEILRQKIPLFFVSLIRLLVKFVVLQSHSQSICVLNQCHIKINTHLFSHIETFCLPL